MTSWSSQTFHLVLFISNKVTVCFGRFKPGIHNRWATVVYFFSPLVILLPFPFISHSLLSADDFMLSSPPSHLFSDIFRALGGRQGLILLI